LIKVVISFLPKFRLILKKEPLRDRSAANESMMQMNFS